MIALVNLNMESSSNVPHDIDTYSRHIADDLLAFNDIDLLAKQDSTIMLPSSN